MKGRARADPGSDVDEVIPRLPDLGYYPTPPSHLHECCWLLLAAVGRCRTWDGPLTARIHNPITPLQATRRRFN
jgi:hypothetical protein